MNNNTPTIKGVFVKSHINMVKQVAEEEEVKQLAEKHGKPLEFKSTDDVPIRDEVSIIEYALDVISTTPVPPEQRAFLAGSLHFKDFLTTPFAKILFPFFKS